MQILISWNAIYIVVRPVAIEMGHSQPFMIDIYGVQQATFTIVQSDQNCPLSIESSRKTFMDIEWYLFSNSDKF